MSLFHCKKCNTIFDVPMESSDKPGSTITFCPACNSHDVARVAS